MIYLFVILFFAVFSTSALGQAVKIGEKQVVTNWKWVEVRNPEPVKNSTNTFDADDLCAIKHGGVVTIAGIDRKLLLAHYSISGIQHGPSCPTGVLFFTSKKGFSKMAMEYQEVNREEQKKKNLLKRFLRY
ncbi:MAG: hypothetical protein WC657_01730 [Candidatus Paceibacterota bacterium]|jgi:hypothetical protein